MDFHFLAPAFVDDEFGAHFYAPVVGPFAPGEPEDEDEGGEGHDAAGGCADARIFYCLCEGVEAGESGFGGHAGWCAARGLALEVILLDVRRCSVGLVVQRCAVMTNASWVSAMRFGKVNGMSDVVFVSFRDYLTPIWPAGTFWLPALDSAASAYDCGAAACA